MIVLDTFHRRAPLSWSKMGPPSPSSVYPLLWSFAAKRHSIYMQRLQGKPPPWTSDGILSQYKFTNVYRASDRVSQFLIRLVYSDETASPASIFLRTILFKVFNKIETWQHFVARAGVPEACTFDPRYFGEMVSDLRREGHKLYSGAYIMPPGITAGEAKHATYLAVIKRMLDDNMPQKVVASRSLREVYELLRAYPSFGPFLSFQFAIDLNYTSMINHTEMDYVVAGPGALDGLSKCFTSLGDYSAEDVIRLLTESQDKEFLRLGIDFRGLWGRPLQLIDVQNLLCEISKYTRASNPEITGLAGRTRIKRRFKPTGPLSRPFFPPKWGLNDLIASRDGY